MIANVIVMLAIGFNVVPAQAYTPIGGSAVQITATGELVGATLTFSGIVVDQATGANSSSAIDFGTISSGINDSGRALKITGGTNEVNARIIIYTDNDNNTYVPGVDPNTGVDGSGMVGETETGYVVPFIWGVKSAADYDPNQNVNYAFDGNLDDGIGEVFVVDKRHTRSFTDGRAFPLLENGWTETQLDTNNLYKADGAVVTNGPSNDNLYPQLWDEDLYDKNPVTDSTAVVVSQALYKNIATVAYNIGAGIDDGVDDDTAYYVCNTANLTTTNTADFVKAKLGKIDTTAGEYLYIYIGADFTGRPAQDYTTNQLYVQMVQN